MKLEGVQEARLAVRSNGGNVDVGKTRATQATISTGAPGSPSPGGVPATCYLAPKNLHGLTVSVNMLRPGSYVPLHA